MNGTVVSAESHAVDRFSGETAGRSAKSRSSLRAMIALEIPLLQCSDVDDDDDDEKEETDVEEGGLITNLPVSSTIVQQQPAFATMDGDVVLPNADQPTFGVKNTMNVNLVSKTCYECPVILKQFVYTNPTPNQDASRTFDNTSDLPTSKDNGAPNGCIFPQNTKLNKVTQWTWKWCTLSCVLGLILAIVVLLIVYLTKGNNGTETTLRIVERDEWGARPPKFLRKIKLPVPYVIICHTASNFCTTQSKCANELRIMQENHMENDYMDIKYNFLVGGDGLAYVGRNWDYIGSHSLNYDVISIGIAFIGNFTSVVPPKTQLRAAQKLIEFGVKAKKIASDYILLGNRQVVNSKSPGDALYNEIKNWPHWSPCPTGC